MNVPFLDLKLQYKGIKDDVLPILTEAMSNGAFVGGPEVSQFEEEFAAFCETRYCAGVASGTDALRFALMAAGIGPGDEVITVPNTFIATTEAISQVGARPIFVDIFLDTFNLDPSKLSAAITGKTKAIIPVHLYGQPADMDAILEVGSRHGLAVIEDACQAHGATYKGKKAGSMGLAGCFSFYPGKNLGAYGEGGAVVSQDAEIVEKVKMLRDHGQSKKYVHEFEGYNGRLDAIQAGILRIKLRRLQDWNDARRKNAQVYDKLLKGIARVKPPSHRAFVEHVYHLYVILTDQRDELQGFLADRGIGTGLHYPIPLHLQRAYKPLGYREGSFPVAEEVSKKLLSLPMFPELTREQIEYVIGAIKEFFKNR